MGLSRNKVAVSEGAAGSPPFYGDRDRMSRFCHTSRRGRYTEGWVRIFCCSIFRDRQWSLKKKEPVVWGCSSVGRAPALQAGGHGFESHHLHQPASRPSPLGVVQRVIRSSFPMVKKHTGGKMGKNQKHRVTVCSSGG